MKKRLRLLYHALVKSRKTFVFNEKKLRYFIPWVRAPRDERVIELPIILDILGRHKKSAILEIGNVMNNYYPFVHDVVDKYEKAEGVINEDIVDYNPPGKYDIIFSISTLEHVGCDEPEKDPAKIMKALSKIKDLLNGGGSAVFTLPIGWNKYFDGKLLAGEIEFSSETFLKRISSDDQWIQINKSEAGSIRYNEPYPYANGIFVGMINKSE